jgi:hypothetical protein
MGSRNAPSRMSEQIATCILRTKRNTHLGAGIEKLAKLDFAKADSASTFIAAAQGSKQFIPECVVISAVAFTMLYVH